MTEENKNLTGVDAEKTSLGLAPNLAAALAYLAGIVTGIIVFIMEKENTFVRFHAMQSIVFFGGIFILSIASNFVPVFGTLLSLTVIPIVSFVGWLYALIRSYQGKTFKFPVVGDLAEKFMNQQ